MQNAGLINGPLKKEEELIQAMMAQNKSLIKGLGPQTDVGELLVLLGCRNVALSPGEVLPPSMNSKCGPI